jgi:hypothetical protein
MLISIFDAEQARVMAEMHQEIQLLISLFILSVRILRWRVSVGMETCKLGLWAECASCCSQHFYCIAHSATLPPPGTHPFTRIRARTLQVLISFYVILYRTAMAEAQREVDKAKHFVLVIPTHVLTREVGPRWLAAAHPPHLVQASRSSPTSAVQCPFSSPARWV